MLSRPSSCDRTGIRHRGVPGATVIFDGRPSQNGRRREDDLTTQSPTEKDARERLMTTPAGWYDDGSGNRRWWDGLSWTEHVVTGHPAAVTESEVTTSTAEDAHVAADPTAPAAATDPWVPTTAATGQPLGSVADLEPAPFAPPYTLAHQMPASPAGTVPSNGAISAPYGGYPAASWPTPSAPQARPGVPVVGIIGLAAVVIGVVCACIPVIAIAGWALLAVGFVMSLVSLFLRGRKWPGITGLALAVIGAVLAAAVSLLLLAATSSDGASSAIPSERPTDGGTSTERPDPSAIEGAEMTTFADLEVGDCLPLVVYDEDELVFELPVVPCEQPHTDEVFFIYDVEDGEFPGDDALTETSWNGCYEAFQAYVGTSYEASELDFYNYQPTKGTWIREGDRTVQCILFSYDDVTGTLRDSGR